MPSKREKILSAALELFNQQGSARITTNHIAEAAGISPGNLYYHFRNKEEVIRALYAQMAEAWESGFKPAPGRLPELKDLEALLKKTFQLIWAYRFFYQELVPLCQRDPELAEQYRGLRQRGQANFAQLVGLFIQQGVFRPLDKGQTQDLADLTWLFCEFWLPYLQLEGEVPAEAIISRGLALFQALLNPYLNQPNEKESPQ